MRVSKLLVTAAVVGLVVNVYDFLIHGIVLQGPVYSKLPLMRTDASLPLLIFSDFVAAAIFVWVYQRVRTVFRPASLAGRRSGCMPECW